MVCTQVIVPSGLLQGETVTWAVCWGGLQQPTGAWASGWVGSDSIGDLGFVSIWVAVKRQVGKYPDFPLPAITREAKKWSVARRLIWLVEKPWSLNIRNISNMKMYPFLRFWVVYFEMLVLAEAYHVGKSLVVAQRLETKFKMKLHLSAKQLGHHVQSPWGPSPFGWHVSFLSCSQEVEEQEQMRKSTWKMSVMIWASARLSPSVFELFPTEPVAFVNSLFLLVNASFQRRHK